jgi:hypothetical protein
MTKLSSSPLFENQIQKQKMRLSGAKGEIEDGMFVSELTLS